MWRVWLCTVYSYVETEFWVGDHGWIVWSGSLRFGLWWWNYTGPSLSGSDAWRQHRRGCDAMSVFRNYVSMLSEAFHRLWLQWLTCFCQSHLTIIPSQVETSDPIWLVLVMQYWPISEGLPCNILVMAWKALWYYESVVELFSNSQKDFHRPGPQWFALLPPQFIIISLPVGP